MSEDSLNTEANHVPALEIAHVLFLDMVGYSRLPMEAQTELLVELQAIVRTNSEFLRAQKLDQLLRLPTGDGMALIFFGDAEAPARCAIEICRVLPQHANLKLRMGIHSGPVQRVEDINTSRNVSGAGINYAQRVMDCGDAGHILVSRTVADLIGETSRWSAALHDLGEVEVKHGARLHFYNLYGENFGNPCLPQKIENQREQAAETERARAAKASVKRGRLSIIVIGVAVFAAMGIVAIFYTRRAHALTNKDTVVLADFDNQTGDKVFDDTLKQGLAVSLSQSPFLSLITDQRINTTLRMMGRQPGDRLTEELARQLCVRTGSKAMFAGSISLLGTQYVIGLKTVHCTDGDVLAQEQVQAQSKEDVLRALDKAAKELREKLGESLSTLQRYDTPLEEASTSSLDALKAYSTAQKAFATEGDAAALPYFQRAVELDPKFALAYRTMAIAYSNLGQATRARDAALKAFELRQRVTEREKYAIEAFYYLLVTGELEKSNQVYELWRKGYPRDAIPASDLGDSYMRMGDWQRAVPPEEEATRLDPSIAMFHSNLAWGELALNRTEQARRTVDGALQRKLDSTFLRLALYETAFLRGDKAGMQQQLDWASGRLGQEDWLLSAQSDTEAYLGRLDKAREFSRRAVESAHRADAKEAAALWQAKAALYEAELGTTNSARQQAMAALAIMPGKDVRTLVALVLARVGEAVEARKLADDLNKELPLDTLVQGYWLPAIRAAINLHENKGESDAVEILKPAMQYELAQNEPFQFGMLYPIYLRGQGYYMAGQGKEAASEFQKIVNHRGVVLNFPLGALAQLQLARAKAITGDKDAARQTYSNFLNLWNSADPGIPILKQAKAEYAKLTDQSP